MALPPATCLKERAPASLLPGLPPCDSFSISTADRRPRAGRALCVLHGIMGAGSFSSVRSTFMTRPVGPRCSRAPPPRCPLLAGCCTGGRWPEGGGKGKLGARARDPKRSINGMTHQGFGELRRPPGEAPTWPPTPPGALACPNNTPTLYPSPSASGTSHSSAICHAQLGQSVSTASFRAYVSTRCSGLMARAVSYSCPRPVRGLGGSAAWVWQAHASRHRSGGDAAAPSPSAAPHPYSPPASVSYIASPLPAGR
jgi:hypothetical protein